MTETRARIDWPTMMIVAFDDSEAKVFSRVLDAQMFKVVRAESLARATELLLGTMPHVVVVAGGALADDAHVAFNEQVAAIGAEVVVLPDGAEPKSVETLLCKAADRALARRGG